MKVWVVICDYFNGEGSSQSVSAVFSTEEKAKKYCGKRNAKATSDYSDKFYICDDGAIIVDEKEGDSQ